MSLNVVASKILRWNIVGINNLRTQFIICTKCSVSVYNDRSIITMKEETSEKSSSVPIQIESDSDQMDTPGGFLANSCRRGRRGICVPVVVFGAIIACVLLAFTAFASPTHTSGNLQQVLIVFRHGDKNPAQTYPNDPYSKYEWPDGWGALTKKGMLQLYTLGQRLREMYRSFIGDKYQSKDLLVHSSYADRCIMSAQALLAALYQPGTEDMFIPGLAWRPIPVHTIPRNIDKLIVAKAPCPRLERELQQAYSNFSASANGSLDTMYRELSDYTGKKIASVLDVELLYNLLEIEVLNNLKLPEWAKNYFNNRTRELAAQSLALFTSNVMQRRLRGGPLLKDILTNMWTRRNGTNDHKMYLYSAHDLTLVTILRTMGFTDELTRPEYGAALIFELYTTAGGQDHEVRISYLNNTETKVPRVMNVKGCEEPCLLETLFGVWEPVLPQDWNSECLT
ncbi:lysosomal acid phosphatase-like isoform X2 [Diprion similis]|uniref:lysosomal acid phosphatase-like isoform X2 n=1 Tax=Diprion similis TaxID=362088 RepID=UPI001EF8A8AE|nr:lysosomal acid phosphatase-like isoform X2 [Diprion similis]